MPNYTVTIDGTDYDVDDAADQAEAQREAEAYHEQKRVKSISEFEQKPYWSQVGQRGKDLARAGVSGITLGMADKGAAALNSWLQDKPMAETSAEQDRLRAGSRDRLNAVNPGTYEATEFGAGLLLPFKSAKVPGITMESGARGAISSFGHGETDPKQLAIDAITNAGVGGVTSGAANIGRYAQKAAPLAADMLRRYGRSWWPTAVSVLHANPLSTAATIASKTAAPKVATGIDRFASGPPIDPETGRKLLSQLTTGFTRQKTDY